MYTVKQLADLAGVSVRTLHYYDEIALLKPSAVGDNGYRYYEDDEMFRLQQILFFRELDLSLNEIRDLMDSPAFDTLSALETHRAALQKRMKRLTHLIHTVDDTIRHLKGEITMSKKQLFAAFSEAEEKQYAQEAEQRYGADEVRASYRLWNSYTAEQKDAIKAEGGAIYSDMAAAIEAGETPSSEVVQTIIARWHQHLRYFYEPSVERLLGLGQLYVESPDFAERFRALHPDLPEFMQDAILLYCETVAVPM